MIKSEKQTIDGIEFKCQQFAAMKSTLLLARIIKLFVPVAGNLGALTLKSEAGELANVILPVLTSMNEEELPKFIIEMLSDTIAIVDGRAIQLDNQANVDAVFSGTLMTMFKAVAFSLKVNFADFYNAVVALGAAVGPAAKPSASS